GGVFRSRLTSQKSDRRKEHGIPMFAQYDIFKNWAATVRNVRKNRRSLAGVEPFLETLETAYHGAVASRSQSDALRAASQEATRQLQATLAAGSDAAARLRSFIKGKLGSRSEQ